MFPIDLPYVFGFLLSTLSFIKHLRQSHLLCEIRSVLLHTSLCLAVRSHGQPCVSLQWLFGQRAPTTRSDSGQR